MVTLSARLKASVMFWFCLLASTQLACFPALADVPALTEGCAQGFDDCGICGGTGPNACGCPILAGNTYIFGRLITDNLNHQCCEVNQGSYWSTPLVAETNGTLSCCSNQINGWGCCNPRDNKDNCGCGIAKVAEWNTLTAINGGTVEYCCPADMKSDGCCPNRVDMYHCGCNVGLWTETNTATKENGGTPAQCCPSLKGGDGCCSPRSDKNKCGCDVALAKENNYLTPVEYRQECCPSKITEQGCCPPRVDVGCGCGAQKIKDNGVPAEECCSFNDYGCCSGQKGCDNICRSGKEDRGCGCGEPAPACYYEYTFKNIIPTWLLFLVSAGNFINAPILTGWSEELDQQAKADCTRHWTETVCKTEFRWGWPPFVEVCRDEPRSEFDEDCFRQRYSDWATTLDRVACTIGQTFINAITMWGFFETRVVHTDSNCREMNPNDGGCYERCGAAEVVFIPIVWWVWGMSPVSLQWNPDADITQSLSYTKFPVNPNMKDRWFLWRASEDFPLVVHDPEHTGEITSAEQLFGHFSFGKTWRDGFAALASLDKNVDGWLSGSELDELGLWFDKNRDGVSQPGEVVDIREAGVTKLFFEIDVHEERIPVLYATRGYERLVDGVTVKGSAYDWISTPFDDRLPADAFDGRQAQPAKSGWEKLSRQEVIDEFTTKNPLADVRGQWDWTAEPDPALPPLSGSLFFREDGDRIEGRSVTSRPIVIEGRPKGAQEVRSYWLSGKKFAKDGRIAIQFDVADTIQSMNAHTTAVLSKDGKSLEGETVTEAAKDPVSGEIMTITYRWKAIRKALQDGK